MSVNSERHQASTSGPGGFSGFEFVGEIAQVNNLAVDLNLGYPLLVSRSPADSAILRRRPLLTREVLHVASVRDFPKVLASVIEADPVDMVPFDTVKGARQTEQLSVHLDGLTPPRAGHCAMGVPSGGIDSPPPLVCPLRISSVDQGVCPDRSTGAMKRDTRSAVAIDDGGITNSSALGRTVASRVSSPFSDLEWSAASRTGQLNKRRILSGHRASPRCQTPAVDAVRGHFVSTFYHKPMREQLERERGMPHRDTAD
jgi:hypothetical protein